MERPLARFLKPLLEVICAESYVVAETVMWDASGASLGKQPRVGDSKQPPGGLGVDQRRERRALIVDAAAVGAGEQRCGASTHGPPVC